MGDKDNSSDSLPSKSRTSIISKIQALLALAKSSNQHEATSAAARAAELMVKHQIEEAEIEAAKPIEEQIREASLNMDPVYRTKKVTMWRYSLLLAVAGVFGCKPLLIKRGRESCFYLAGIEDDIAGARVLYHWLSLKIESLADIVCKGRGMSISQSYCIGFVEGIQFSMNEAEREAKKTASSSALAIVTNKIVLASAAITKAVGKTEKVAQKSKVRLDDAAFGAGFERGKKEQIGDRAKKLN